LRIQNVKNRGYGDAQNYECDPYDREALAATH
jgi:hypothetical protein